MKTHRTGQKDSCVETLPAKSEKDATRQAAIKMGNKAEDCLFFLRLHGLITESMVDHVRHRILQRLSTKPRL